MTPPTTHTDATIRTAEQLLRAGDIGRCELIRGELIQMSPSGGQHGDIAMSIGYFLKHHVRHHRLGRVYGAETGFIIERDPDTVRAPDAAFIAAERAQRVHTRKFIPGAPDLAVEVLSPDDRAAEVLAKIRQWLDAGCREVWLIDPDRKTLSVHRADRPVQTLAGDQVLTCAELLPGFQLRIAEVFQS